jgi:hypothetical protein
MQPIKLRLKSIKFLFVAISVLSFLWLLYLKVPLNFQENVTGSSVVYSIIIDVNI